MDDMEPRYITKAKQRCKEAGLDPNGIPAPKISLTKDQLAKKQQTYGEILSVISFFSNKLLHSLEGTPVMVAVSDAEGYLLKVEGDASIKSTVEEFGAHIGSLFTIEDTGVNAISLTLMQQKPVTLVGEQHFHTALYGIACYGDTFFYTDDNNLLGTMTLMLPRSFQNPLFLKMLSQTVDSIERELLLRKQNRKLHVMNQIILSQSSNGVVISNADGMITEYNAYAQQIFGSCISDVVGTNIQESVLTGRYFTKVLENEETFRNEEIEFTNSLGEKVICLFDAQPIFEKDQLIGAFGQFRDITERYQLQQQYNYLAFHDDLTDLPNRRFIKQKIETLISSAEPGKKLKLALLFLDLDRFKIINDNFGHSTGDEFLIEVSKRLEKCLGKKDVLARMGGDEFIFLIQDYTYEAEVIEKAEEILTQFSTPFHVGHHELHTTVSVGVAIYPDNPISPEQLMVYADNAMYKAKGAGKNRYALYTSELFINMVEELQLESDLTSALANDEFILHYQPQFSNENGDLIGVEALLRWVHPELGLIYPDKFIKKAEDTGLITEIGEWVIRQACLQHKQWLPKEISPLKIAVNLSTQQFLKPNLVSYVKQTLYETGMDPACLVLEITEYMAMEYHHSLKVMQQLKELGVCISIDDFGTGYSSLKYLKDFPIDFLKIDKSFVQEIVDDDNDAAIVTAIVNLAHTLKLQVIAEGVETKAQLCFLKRFSCGMAQGYLFSKPLPVDQFEYSYPELIRRAKAILQNKGKYELGNQ